MTTVHLDDAWTITGHLNGGYLTSVCGTLASEVLDGTEPLTISTHYLHAARGAGPAEAAVEVLRRGRLSTARVTLSRGDVLLVDALVTTGTPKDAPVVVEESRPPALPPIEECPDSAPGGRAPGMDLLHTLDVRTDPSVGRAVSGGEPLDDLVTWGWCRYRDGRDVDATLLMAAWDVLPPTLWVAHHFVGTPTVSSQVVLYPGEVTGPLVLEARCDTVRGGVIDETARVWDSTGRLVSSARQTALVTAPLTVRP